MGGYIDRSQGVQGVLDPLEVHVVTFADDGHRFALVVADLICVNVDVVDRIRTAMRGIGVSSCWVAATHTHASPEAGCFPGGTVTPRPVGDRLVAASLAAARHAMASERAARIGASRTLVPGFAGRRNLADTPPMDIPVDTIAVTAGTDVVGLIVVSPVHPTVLPADNNQVSADLVAASAERCPHPTDGWSSPPALPATSVPGTPARDMGDRKWTGSAPG